MPAAATELTSRQLVAKAPPPFVAFHGSKSPKVEREKIYTVSPTLPVFQKLTMAWTQNERAQTLRLRPRIDATPSQKVFILRATPLLCSPSASAHLCHATAR